MISIRQILQPGHVNLSLNGTTQAGVIEEVLTSLRGDLRIHQWDSLRAAVIERDAPAVSSPACGIVIAHGRTDAVGSLVMAAGRSSAGIPLPGSTQVIRLVFVAGIPAAFSNEYLRVVGAIARLCSKPDLVQDLLASPDSASFIELLARAETSL
jgi:mannitol/fructose-specific phosphotransferase system IIA component (Ntr-type)